MKTISVETLIKTIRDNYDKYIEEGFDVPEVKIEHGNRFVKLETDELDWEQVCRECLSEMSEDSVKEMCVTTEFVEVDDEDC